MTTKTVTNNTKQFDIFPIKTDTACQLKWTWSTVRLYTGRTSSCHRVQSSVITADSFDGFHNTPKQIEDRQLMLKGQWPSGGCEYCKKIEDAGGLSDRLLHLGIPDLVPPELHTDPTATFVTPRILEVYFDNLCNMACLYCYDGFSSKIQQENIKHGRFEKNGIVIDNRAQKVSDFEQMSAKFWTYMELHGKTLKRLHVLGGEPLYQKQFNRCLDFFQQHPCPDIELNIVSNLMIDHQKLVEHIGRIRHLIANRCISRFDLTASIDCFGPAQEYVRYGIDMERWQENFKYICDQRWIKVNINQTISGLTIKTSAELLKFVQSIRTVRPIGQYFSTTISTHDFLHPKIFGRGFFDRDFEQILRNMPRETQEHQRVYAYMQGTQAEINTHSRDQRHINQLGIYLDEIDRRRNLNWKQTFPWLVEEIDLVV
jgi:hypothetical protein